MTDAANLPPENDDDDQGGGLPPAASEVVEAPAAPAATAPKTKPGGKSPAAPKAVAPAAGAAPAAPAAKADGFTGKRVRIIIEENDNIPPTGLFVSSNGRPFLIRAGEEVEVPIEIVEVLNDAIEETPKTDQGGNVVDYRKKMRFPYRLAGR